MANAADAAITNYSTGEDGRFNAKSTRMADQENAQHESPFLNPELYRKPEYFVYVYSVVDPRPSDNKLIRHQPPLVKNLRIPELKPGERYTLVTRLAHPVNQPDIDVNSGQRTMHMHNAKRVAMDIVNPANMNEDQDAVVAAEKDFSFGTDNYGRLGVFWSVNNPPTDEEIAKAIKRKENFYRGLLTEARTLEASNPGKLHERLTANHHIAADYFGEEYAWHRTAKRPFTCPNCGEPVKEGAAYHRGVDGIICVIDWKGAVNAGVKKREDVPEELRWWTEAKRGPGRPPKSFTGETESGEPS